MTTLEKKQELGLREGIVLVVVDPGFDPMLLDLRAHEIPLHPRNSHLQRKRKKPCVSYSLSVRRTWKWNPTGIFLIELSHGLDELIQG